MGRFPAPRCIQAAAVTAVGVPGILLAHLATTGRAAAPLVAAAVIGVVLAISALFPARTARRVAVVTAAGQVAGHTVLALATSTGASSSGCIPAVGRGAWFGLHLALLRPDAACPAGSFAPGPSAAALTAVLAAVAILAGHALAAGMSGWLLTAGRHALRVLGGLGEMTTRSRLVRWLLLAVTARAFLPARRPQPPLPRARRALTSQWRPGAVLLRGPPATHRRALPAAAS